MYPDIPASRLSHRRGYLYNPLSVTTPIHNPPRVFFQRPYSIVGRRGGGTAVPGNPFLRAAHAWWAGRGHFSPRCACCKSEGVGAFLRSCSRWVSGARGGGGIDELIFLSESGWIYSYGGTEFANYVPRGKSAAGYTISRGSRGFWDKCWVRLQRDWVTHWVVDEIEGKFEVVPHSAFF